MKIASMMPPGDWGARFDGSKSLQPLVCWALVEVEGGNEIKGMVAAEYQQILPCDCFDAFLCYEPKVLPND
jgi:hypothetical protein